VNGPLKEKRDLGTALNTAELPTPYHFSRLLQAFSVRKTPMRRCVSCDSRITNRNLGGNSGRSALSGSVWCLRCADFPQQFLLRLGGLR